MSFKEFTDWYYNPGSTVGTAVSLIANFFGLNVKNFDSLYSKSSELRAKVDRLAEDYIRKFEDKLANSTPSTSPSLSRFIQQQLEKDKDVVLAMQRKVQNLTDSIERDKDNPVIDLKKRDEMKENLNQAEQAVNEGLKSLSNNKTTSTIVHGAQDRFTNAQIANNWKEKQNNAKVK